MLHGSAILELGAAQDAPKSAPRRSWRATFSLLKIVLNLDSIWGPILVDFGSQIPPKKLARSPPLLHLESVRFSSYVMHRFKMAQEPAKRPQDPPKGAPRGSQKRPRRLQEGVKRPQESVQRAQSLPKSSQEPPKTPTRLFRSTWAGSRFRKNQKNQIMAPKSIEDA